MLRCSVRNASQWSLFTAIRGRVVKMQKITHILAYFGNSRQLLAAAIFFALLFVASRYLGERYLYVAYSAISTFALFCVLAYLGWTGVALASLLVLLISLQVSYRFHFGEHMSLGVLQSVVETNVGEVRSMAGLVFRLLWGAILPLLILWVSFVHFRKNRTQPILNIFLILSLVSTFFLWPLPINRRFVTDIESYPAFAGELYRRINNLVLGDFLVVTTTLLTDLKYSHDSPKTSSPNIIGHGEPVSETIVIVIGEASFPGRYGVYGYGTPTTPNLERMANEKDTCIVKKVHSAAPITRTSISMSLSFRNPEQFAPLIKQESIINLAKESGFKTYWIASQSLSGVHETEYGYIAKDSDVVWYTDKEDDKLAPLLEKALREDSEHGRKFVVLHMVGSHWPYSERFDKMDIEALPDADDYDRSIRKTDRILGSVIHALSVNERKYAMLFFSDHGEIVGKGHGINRGGATQYLIPYIIKAPGVSMDMCGFMETLRNADGYISALSNKFVLLKLLGYEVNPEYVVSEVQNDRVLHSSGQVYDWQYFLRESVDYGAIQNLR